MVTPRRIASLISSATEMIYALGLGEQLVAVSHECDYPADVASKPRVTYSNIDCQLSSKSIDDEVQQFVADGAPLYEIDQEQLIQLAPDLIVTQAQCDVCAVKYDDVLTMVGTHDAFCDTQLLALNPMSLDEIFADIHRMGQATGADDAAERFVTSLRDRIAKVEHVTDNLSPDQLPRVACIEWIEPIMLAANWVPRLIELAGATNDLTLGDRHGTYSSWSDVVKYDPQVIVVMPCGFNLQRTVEESRILPTFDRWHELSAVKADRVFAVDGNAYFNRSGPRIVDSLEILAHLIHPELCDAPFSPDARNSAWCRLRTDGQTICSVPAT